MCRSTALLVPVLILGLARGVLHDLPIVHSDYSPMVTRVQIGTPPQYVLMRVSFADVESHLFTPSDCPPFVVCFHPRSSTSYGVLELPAGGEDGVVVLDGSRRVDTLNILGSSQFEFTSSPVLGSDCLVSRDVAGRLGMGFGSQLTRQSSIEIKVQLPIRQKTTQAVPQWSVVLGKTPSFKWPDRKVITVPVHEQQGAWRVSTAITIGGDKLFDHFAPQLVPDVEDIVIPAVDRDTVFGLLRWGAMMINGNRIFVRCAADGLSADVSELGGIGLRFYPDRNWLVRILPETLIYTGLQNGNSVFPEGTHNFCPTRIVFSDEIDSWIFGLPLFASVESVVLDHRTGSIQLRRLRRYAQRPSSVLPLPSSPSFPLHRIPEFSPPLVIPSGDGLEEQLRIELASGWSSAGRRVGLVLESTMPTRTSDSGDIEFRFLKKRHTLLVYTEYETTMEWGNKSFHMPKPVADLTLIDGDLAVSFQFVIAQNRSLSSYSVSLVEDAVSVSVKMRRVEMQVELRHFAIPAPIVRGSVVAATDDGSCTICMDPIEIGETEQRLPCDHAFHVHCIAPWLSEHDSCANCRQQVPPSDDRFLLTPVSAL